MARVLGAVVVALLVASCGASEPEPLIRFSGRPPPKPGSSITHSALCTCSVCEPSSCCQGPESGDTAEVCDQGYDFTKNEQCGVAIQSCVGRCVPRRWRVRRAETCESRAPSECCPGHPIERDG